jgi:hypothetical protein
LPAPRRNFFLACCDVACFFRERVDGSRLVTARGTALAMANAAANALGNLAKAAIGLGVTGTALNASMYDGACAIRSDRSIALSLNCRPLPTKRTIRRRRVDD